MSDDWGNEPVVAAQDWGNEPVQGAAVATPAAHRDTLGGTLDYAARQLGGAGEAGISALESIYAQPLAALSREVARAIPGADPDKVHEAVIKHLVSQWNPDNDTLNAVSGAIGLPARAVGAAADAGIRQLPASVQPIAQQIKGAGADMLALAPAAPLAAAIPIAKASNPIADTVREQSAPEQAVARSPSDIAQAAGYTGLTHKGDLKMPGAQQVTNTLIAKDAGLPEGVTPNVAAMQNARKVGPGKVYDAAEATLPSDLKQDQALRTDIAKLQDGTSQLPKSPDVEALKEHMLGQPDMTRDELFSNVRTARDRAATYLASEDPEKNALGDAYHGLADAYEGFIGRKLDADPNSPVTLDQWQAARTQFAKNYLAEKALKGGENFDAGVYAKAMERNPGLLTGNAAIVGTVANNLKSAPGAVSEWSTRAAGAAAGEGVGHALGVPFVGGAAGILAGPMVRHGIEHYLTRGDTDAAAATSTNPALSYFFDRGALPEAAPGDPTGGLSLASGPLSAAPRANHSDFASVLSQGIGEHPAAPGLSLAPAAEHIRAPDFSGSEAGRLAGDLQLLHDKYMRAPVANLSDYAAVKSQGVPEGIVQRTPKAAPAGDIDLIAPAEQARREQLLRAVNESASSFARGGQVMAKDKVHHIKDSDLKMLIAMLGQTLAGIHQRQQATAPPPQRPPMAGPPGAPPGAPQGMPPALLQRLAQMQAMRRMQGAGGPPQGAPPPPMQGPPPGMPPRMAAYGGLQMGLNRMEPQGQFNRGVAHSMNLRPHMGVGVHPLRLAGGGYVPMSVGAQMPPGVAAALAQSQNAGQGLGSLASQYNIGNQPQRPLGM